MGDHFPNKISINAVVFTCIFHPVKHVGSDLTEALEIGILLRFCIFILAAVFQDSSHIGNAPPLLHDNVFCNILQWYPCGVFQERDGHFNRGFVVGNHLHYEIVRNAVCQFGIMHSANHIFQYFMVLFQIAYGSFAEFCLNVYFTSPVLCPYYNFMLERIS